MTKKVLHFPERKDKLEDYNNQPCFSVLDEDDKFMMKVQKFRLKHCYPEDEGSEVFGSIVLDDEELTIFINDSSHPNKHYALAKICFLPVNQYLNGQGSDKRGVISVTFIRSESGSASSESHRKLVDLTTNTPSSYWDTEDV